MHTVAFNEDQALSLASYGWRCVEAGELDSGLAALLEAEIAKPDHPEIQKAVGLAYARAMTPHLALRRLRAYLAKHPDDIEILCVAGELFLQRLDYASMADALGKCLKLDPTAAHPSGVRARALIKKAEKQLRQATGKT
jgi:tetratricopeptide (TPR) repeat protein